MKRNKIAVAVLAVALAAGCSNNPYIRSAETRGVFWGVTGTVLIAGLLYSIFSYRQQPAAGGSTQYAPPAIPVGARVVDCRSSNVRGPCWIMPEWGETPPPPNARVVGKKSVQTGWETRISNDCTDGFKSPDPLPIPKRGEKIKVTCVPE